VLGDHCAASLFLSERTVQREIGALRRAIAGLGTRA
jgi:hypothetical protein